MDLPAHLEGTLDPDQRLAVAWSGGLDSSVLVHAAVAALGRDRVVAVHVHHHLRDEADADASFCADEARRMGIRLIVEHVHPDDSNTQADARSRRYAALARAADASGCAAIATAHHADDAVETFLERLSRGAGLTAMTGLSADVSIAHHRVIRPFLERTRRELEHWAQTHDIGHRHDRSNESTSYRRNAIRHDVVPALTAEHGPEALLRSVRNLRSESALIQAAVDQLVLAATEPSPGRRSARIRRDWLMTAEAGLRRRALIDVAAGQGISLQEKHFTQLEAPSSEPRRLDLPGGHVVASDQFWTFHRAPEMPRRAPTVEIPGHVEAGTLHWFDLVIMWGTFDDGLHLCLPEGASWVVRGLQPGDSLSTDGGNQAVKELLRAAGVPAEDRWRWPVVTVDDTCRVVPGVRSADPQVGEHRRSIRIARRARAKE